MFEFDTNLKKKMIFYVGATRQVLEPFLERKFAHFQFYSWRLLRYSLVYWSQRLAFDIFCVIFRNIILIFRRYLSYFWRRINPSHTHKNSFTVKDRVKKKIIIICIRKRLHPLRRRATFSFSMLMSSRMCMSHEKQINASLTLSVKWVCVFNFLDRWFYLHIKFIMSMFFSHHPK